MGALRVEVRCDHKCITNIVMCFRDATFLWQFCLFSSSQLDPEVPELSVQTSVHRLASSA